MITNLRVVCSVLYPLLMKLTCRSENSVDPDQLASLQCTVYICFRTVLESIYTLFQHSKVGISKSIL